MAVYHLLMRSISNSSVVLSQIGTQHTFQLSLSIRAFVKHRTTEPELIKTAKMSTKRYGLILQDKGKTPVFKASHNVFGNDSDSEEETKKRPLLRPSDITARQAKITQEKAVLEDPTVYQYDEIYDKMASKKEKEKVKTKEEKKPQYIENLMKAASKRKIENERRVERQIQKEREKEGDEFQDKEVFVTSAYKKKLEEMRIEEEKEKREEYLESIGDVTKQQDLGGFYRHLYEQKLGKDENADKIKENNEDLTTKQPDSDKTEIPLKRNYRKRNLSDTKANLSDGEIEDSDEEINRVNLDDIRIAKRSKQVEENIDADSDFSIDESSDEETDKKVAKVKHSHDHDKVDDIKTDVLESDKKSKTVSQNTNVTQDDKVEPVEHTPKIDIWKKRTVGVVFDEALKRYYERKAARGS